MIKKNSFSIVAIFFIHNYVHDTLRLLIDEQIFLSPQVKWSVIITSKLVYTSCLTSCWKFRKFGNIRKISNLHRVIASSLVLLLKLKFCRTGKNLISSRSVLSPMKNRVCLKYFVNNFRQMKVFRYTGIWQKNLKISILFFSVALID